MSLNLISGGSDASLRVLVVEDNDDDAVLLSAQLSSAGRMVEYKRVDNAEGMREALREAEWDIVISDHVMPRFSSTEALSVLRQSGRSLPFIIYSGCISEQVIAAAQQAGISNCILKGRVEQLMPAVERELRDGGAGSSGIAAVNLVQIAEYDRITGMPGRALFMRQASARLEVGGVDEHIVVCFVDLARFMRVNQTIGYEAADRVLAQIARRLKAAATPDGLVSRLSGDKFGIVRGGFRNTSEIKVFAERLISILGESCDHEGLQLHLASSMGVSVFPEDGCTLTELLLHAETAMFQCKKLLGHNGFLFYFKGMDEDAGAQLVLESALWRATALSELFLVFQPVISLSSGSVVTMEALTRWRHPEFGMLSPDRFMQVAEESGLMAGISEWVLTEACRQARTWQMAGFGYLGVSVNVSASQFSQPSLLSRVARVLRESRFAPELLTLEITESALMHDGVSALRQLQELKKMGVRIAIDDFGAGHSSLSYLKKYPVDELKIDRSFVCGIEHAAKDAAVMRSIIDLGHSLGLAVLAVGVESAEQIAFLRKHGCDFVQGFFFSEPIRSIEVPVFAAGNAVDNFS